MKYLKTMKFLVALILGSSILLAQGTQPLPKTDLPAPPEGYSWLRLAEIKASILTPKDWHFKQVGGKTTLAYFISQENIDKEGRYITGFTLQAMRPPQPRTGEDLAKTMIANAEQKKMLLRSWKTEKGVFASYGLEYKTQSKDNEVTRVQGLIICNTQTKTFYFCLFESAESKWAETWKIGEKMIQSMKLNDDI